MENGVPVSGSYYIYAPNKGAPPFFAVAFAASTAYHAYQCFRYKCFKLTILFVVTCFLFTIGYVLRAYGAFHYTQLAVYLFSTLLINFSPPLLELQNYHILGRILYYVPYMSPIHPGRVLTTFGMLSAVVEVLNAIGITYAVNPTLPENIIKLGSALMKTSLALQVIVIALFYLLAGLVHVRCARAGLNKRNIRNPLLVLYASSFLIFVRTIYRMVEFFGYTNLHVDKDFDPLSLSPLLRYEWFFYIFEATAMLVNVALWNAFHPRRYLPESDRIYLKRDGITEVEGPGWKDKRSFLVTAIDPFGWFLKTPGDDKRPFWEVEEGESNSVKIGESRV